MGARVSSESVSVIKGGRTLAIAVFVVAVAVMPLGALLSGGVFETWLPGSGGGMPSMPRVHVALQDHTGLVRAIAPARADTGLEQVVNASHSRSILHVSWMGGCGDHTTYLTFERTGDGFRIRKGTDRSDCAFLVGYTRTVGIALWAPVDASTVRFESAP